MDRGDKDADSGKGGEDNDKEQRAAAQSNDDIIDFATTTIMDTSSIPDSARRMGNHHPS